MSDTNKGLGNRTFDVATSSLTFFTANTATGTYCFVKSALFSNVTTGSVTFTFLLNGNEFPKSATITIDDKMLAIPYLDAVLSAGGTLGGYASGSDTVKYF